MWFFGKKQSRANENNQKKDEMLKAIDALLYRIDQHRYAENLDADYMSEVGEQLRGYIENFQYETFAYEDNIDTIVGKIRENVKQLRKAMDAGLTSRVKSAAKDLSDNFEDLKTGHFDGGNPDEDNAPKQSSQQRSLSEKLEKLRSIEDSNSKEKDKLDKSNGDLKLEKKELEGRLCKCEKEDKDRIRDLYRQICACEEKIKTNSSWFNKYSNCQGSLEKICNCVEAALREGEDQKMECVNAYLNVKMDEIRAVALDPSKLDTIWKGLDSEIKKQDDKVRRSDETHTMQTMESSSTTIDPAEKFREELLRHQEEENAKRQREENAKNMETIDNILDEKDTTVTQEVK